MNIVTSVNDWRALKSHLKNKTVGFVPTMGHLHEGHLSLCRRSKAENKISVASIFVNPTQFNQTADFEKYPRTLMEDIEILTSCGMDYLFSPAPDEMYSDNYEFQVLETNISRILEGEYRPGHFSGMLTIVLKLLNLIQPARAYFGEKDYQQLLLIQKMVQAFFLPVEIVGCETLRAEDGLALSSRNSRLDKEQRQKAVHFSHYLQHARTPEEAIVQLNALGFRVDYISEKWQRRLGAVWLDDIRLIDNVEK